MAPTKKTKAPRQETKKMDENTNGSTLQAVARIDVCARCAVEPTAVVTVTDDDTGNTVELCMSCANALRDEVTACNPYEVGPIQREVYALANVGVTVGAGKSKVIQETLAKIKAASGLFADPAHIAGHSSPRLRSRSASL